MSEFNEGITILIAMCVAFIGILIYGAERYYATDDDTFLAALVTGAVGLLLSVITLIMVVSNITGLK